MNMKYSNFISSLVNFFVITLIQISVLNLGVNGEIYQPTQEEIERFQLIQEQIRQHQQEELRQKKYEENQQKSQEQKNAVVSALLINDETQARYPHLIFSQPNSVLTPLLINKQLIHSDHRPFMVKPGPSPISAEHRDFFLTPQFSFPYHINLDQQKQKGSIINENLNFKNSHNSALLHELNMINPQLPEEIRSKLIKQNYHQQSNKVGSSHDRKHTESEHEESDRFDKSHPSGSNIKHEDKQQGLAFGPPYRCYSCQWNIAQCSDFNCYNNPDRCTNNNFSPHMVQQADCIGGCEQFVITDPNGLVQQWKRGCASPSNLPIKRMRCMTHYEFGVRIDRCICNHDWCNGSLSGIHKPFKLCWVITLSMILATLIL